VFQDKKMGGNASLSIVSITPSGGCSGLEPLFHNPDDNNSHAELSGCAGDLSHKARLAPDETMALTVDELWSFPASDRLYLFSLRGP
jgi:hypothetical protein